MRTIVALLFSASVCAAQSAAPVAGYRTHQSVRAPAAGMRFELLEDVRLPDTTVSLRPAIVRLVDRSGAERGRLTLERPAAELKRIAISKRDSATEVNVDLSADAGSYSGPLVRFLSMDNGHIAWTQVVDSAGHHADLALPTTLKTAWQFASSGGRPEILLVSCRPDFSRPASDTAAAFVTTYSRLYMLGGVWHRVDRQVRGIWENDGDFPERSLFP